MTFSKKLLGVSVLAMLLAAPFTAQAHRQWLGVSAQQVEGKEPYVTFDASVSEGLFEFDSFTLKLDGLVITGPDGTTFTPENVSAGKLRSTFDLKLSKPGTYKAAILTESVMARYTLNGEQKTFRGTPETFAKEVPANAEGLQTSRMIGRLETVVTLGKANDAALAPTGKGLELVPLTHPSDFVAGEGARFRFLLDGKPAANLAVSVIPGGVKYRNALKDTSVTTDTNGEFTVVWPIAERYWIGASYPPRQQQAPGAGEGGPGGQAPQAAPQGAGAPGAGQGAGGPGGGQMRPMVPLRVSYAGTFEVLPN